MAKYNENDGSWSASDNSRHYSEHDANVHNSTISSGGYGDSGGGYATKGAELLGGLADMSEGMMLSVMAALMTLGIMVAYFFWGNSYGYAVYINWWFLFLPLIAGVLMKFLEALWRPIAGVLMGVISVALGTLLWLNLHTEAVFKPHEAVIAEGVRMRAEPSVNAAALPMSKNGSKVKALGVTKNGWVKTENISVNGGKELKTIQTAVVLANTLNIHSYPRLASTIQKKESDGLKYAKKGDRVVVMGAEADGWLPVCYFIRDSYQKSISVKGYVLANNIFVEDGSGAKKPAGLTDPEGIKEITVVKKNIFLFSRIYNDVRFHNKEIPKGDKFIMLENPTERGWIRAWYDGVEGWVKVYDVDMTQVDE
jgi:hypothetical protein